MITAFMADARTQVEAVLGTERGSMSRSTPQRIPTLGSMGSLLANLSRGRGKPNPATSAMKTMFLLGNRPPWSEYRSRITSEQFKGIP